MTQRSFIENKLVVSLALGDEQCSLQPARELGRRNGRVLGG
jgi:hypothetical protein